MAFQKPWSPETAASRLAEVIERVGSDAPELRSVFTETFFDQAQNQVSELSKTADSPLSGALVSVKDLFDVEGFVTRAGSRILADQPAATSDAPPIKLLRDAGAILIGHSNMTELAYSGLGLNPHFGTADNALVSGRIPGGSTSGGAVSVAQGIADITIGTDTGGSLRIPAAFNGIVGFKPTQDSVSRRGCKALSQSLDSVGPMARSVEACEIAYQVMAGAAASAGEDLAREFIMPVNFGLDDLDPIVAEGFEKAVALISDAGFNVVVKNLSSLERYKELAVWQFAAIESRAEYDSYYNSKAELFDPRVLSRLKRADDLDAVSYRKTLNARDAFIDAYHAEVGNRVLLLPTTPILAPELSVFDDDDEYYRLNLLALRNPSLANVLNGCSISLPFKAGNETIGIMLTAPGGCDRSLLEVAKDLRRCFVLGPGRPRSGIPDADQSP